MQFVVSALLLFCIVPLLLLSNPFSLLAQFPAYFPEMSFLGSFVCVEIGLFVLLLLLGVFFFRARR